MFHPDMYTHQSVARETAETGWTPHPVCTGGAPYALAVLRAASPGVAGRGGLLLLIVPVKKHKLLGEPRARLASRTPITEWGPEHTTRPAVGHT